MNDKKFDFGMIGLGVMGRNLLLNMADHGFSVAGYDQDPTKGVTLESSAPKGSNVKALGNLEEMIQSLTPPRRMMMLVPAGVAVDEVLNKLVPILGKGDIVIDGGNSHYTDTLRRLEFLKDKGFHFIGMGISGGEKGARTGPSIMPGGDPEAYASLRTILEAVAAKVDGSPCVAYLGKGSAGHYVKMVHNGIEYAIMQLISESYQLLHEGLGLNNDQLHEVFLNWNLGSLKSFLIEITSEIFLNEDEKTGNRLIDMISDQAGSKGTGKWTSQDAMNLPVAVPLIDTAVSVRDLSTYKEERIRASGIYIDAPVSFTGDPKNFIRELGESLEFSMVIAYAQGFSMLYQASSKLSMNIPLPEVVRVWRGGCIIRSSFLDLFLSAFQNNPFLSNLMLDQGVARLLVSRQLSLRNIVSDATTTRFPIPGLMSTLAYFDSYRNARMPTNLVQAQRDFFGAHTYQRIDAPGSFHTEWDT